MALANFFDKVSLSASQRLRNYDRSDFEQKLLGHRIGIVFGSNAINTNEGRTGLDLATRLLSRFYPSLAFVDLANTIESASFVKGLKRISQGINPLIEFADGQDATANMVIGELNMWSAESSSFFVGSDRWEAYFSTTGSKSCQGSNNPFGIGAGVCFAAANLFRFVFASDLRGLSLDPNFSFSVINHKVNSRDLNPDLPDSIPVSFTLAGAGAIGNGIIWSLLQLPELNGTINLIDHQEVDLSNLQRYVLMDQKSIGKRKVDLLKIMLAKFSHLYVHTHSEKWQETAGKLSTDQIKLLITALDSPIERVKIQSILPKKIINGWTGPDGLGVSRHLDFESDPCLSCLYLPTGKTKSYSETIAESLGMSEQERMVRTYLANQLPIDDHFVQVASQMMGRSVQDLEPYKGQLLEIFYSDAICGGKIIPINNKAVEVPLAHESALAGILVAAEIVIESLTLRPCLIEPVTKINLMKPLHPFLLEAERKHFSNNCICQDQRYIVRFKEKWVI